MELRLRSQMMIRLVAPKGFDRFRYHDVVSDRSLQVFGFCPEATGRVRILFVMHGVKRNAEHYRDSWLPIAQRYGLVLVAPEFSEQMFPGHESYNLGGLTNNCRSKTAFAILERLFDHVREMLGVSQTSYLIYGHSAGAQFVHRLLLFHESNRSEIAVAANAGWYSFPCLETDFPYGLAQTHCTDQQLRYALNQRLVLLLGANDTDAQDPNLRQTFKAQQQGRNRLQRGVNKFRFAANAAARMNTTFAWKLEMVQEAGHSNRAMMKAAARVLVEHSD